MGVVMVAVVVCGSVGQVVGWRVASVVRRVFGSGDEKIKVHGFDDLMVFRARCCNPIRGEKIIG